MDKRLGACWFLSLLASCAAGTENICYRLTPVGADDVAFSAEQIGDRHVTVHLPALLDRAEVVAATGPQTIAIYKSERWEAPLDEMVSRVFGEDLAIAKPGIADPDSRRSEVHIGI